MVMVLIVLQSAIVLSAVAAAVGSTVGLIAKRRNWPAKRTFFVAFFGFLALIGVVAFVLEILLRLDSPWPPRVLAQRGFPLAGAAAGAYLYLLAWLAGWLAQRLRSAVPSQT
jgi:hypothetical protein